MSKAKAIAIAT
jgi:predicted nucleic acid-binding protein